MGKKLFTVLAWAISVSSLLSQMNIGGRSQYGNEWIDFEKTYFKIKLAEDGIYRITGSELEASGVPLSEINSNNLQLYYFGEQVPIRVSIQGTIGEEDFIEFYGKKNRGELDWHAYEEPEIKQLNYDYSLITDTSSYFSCFISGSS